VIAGEEDQYRLSLEDFSGTAAFLEDAVGQKFSTIDNDNDQSAYANCAQIVGGGWWFSNCNPKVCLTGSKNYFRADKYILKYARILLSRAPAPVDVTGKEHVESEGAKSEEQGSKVPAHSGSDERPYRPAPVEVSKTHPIPASKPSSEETKYPPSKSASTEEHPPSKSASTEEHPPSKSASKEEYPPSKSVSNEQNSPSKSASKEEHPPSKSVSKEQYPPSKSASKEEHSPSKSASKESPYAP